MLCAVVEETAKNLEKILSATYYSFLVNRIVGIVNEDYIGAFYKSKRITELATHQVSSNLKIGALRFELYQDLVIEIIASVSSVKCLLEFD